MPDMPYLALMTATNTNRLVRDCKTGDVLPGRPTAALCRASDNAIPSGVVEAYCASGRWHLHGAAGIQHKGVTARASVWVD